MQHEIKKRARFYGAVALVSALVLGTFCYNVGVYPIFKPLSFSGNFGTFSSYEELKSFLLANSRIQGAFRIYGPLDKMFVNDEVFSLSEGGGIKAPSEPSFSTTNIQVAGVDEADTVKNDGQFIYTISGRNVFIVMAYPSNVAHIASKIALGDMTPVGIYVYGQRLVVVGSKYQGLEVFPYVSGDKTRMSGEIRTSVDIYDVSNKANPVLAWNYTFSGSYFNSRMIGNYVYFVVSQAAYVVDDTVSLPTIYSRYGERQITPSEIHYMNVSENYFQFTTFVALNVQSDEPPTYLATMIGGTSNMYVSLSNLYVTSQDAYGNTSIYRMHVTNQNIALEANGTAPGHEVNQFSMDEKGEYFRIATTTWSNGVSSSNLYVLNMNLTIVGKLENIAPNETLDSTRFLDNRCYLSTSVIRRDPFFVIDLENASEPKILGYLKIPGFTRYLHPYDESHVIGVGMNGSNLKISIFDVTNVSSPVELGNYVVGGDYSASDALSDHRAFLFEKSKDLLVLPVSTSNWSPDRYDIWQGVYIFNVTTAGGLTLRGTVTHQEIDTVKWDSGYWIKRALYIEDILYTVSEKRIRLNDLGNLQPKLTIDLS